MKVAFEHLPSSTLESLRQMLSKGGPGRGALLHRPSLRWQTILGWIAAAVGAVGISIAVSMAGDERMRPWGPVISGGVSGLFLLYAIAALRDRFLRRRHGLDAFILVTPTNVVRCWGAHQPLEFHRLKDATAFKTFQEYDQKQRYKGRKFRFAFNKQVVEFLVSDPKRVSDLDEVVELGRAKGRGEPVADFPGARIPDLMPAAPETQQGFLMQVFMNPRSEFWMAVGALVCLGILIGIIASR